MKINTNQQEIEYKGLYFPFRAVKKAIEAELTEKQLSRYCIHKTFDKASGKIIRKYAWESIFIDMHKAGALSQLLDEIIQKEYLD